MAAIILLLTRNCNSRLRNRFCLHYFEYELMAGEVPCTASYLELYLIRLKDLP